MLHPLTEINIRFIAHNETLLGAVFHERNSYPRMKLIWKSFFPLYYHIFLKRLLNSSGDIKNRW